MSIVGDGRMPQIASRVVDPLGSELVSQWILGMGDKRPVPTAVPVPRPRTGPLLAAILVLQLIGVAVHCVARLPTFKVRSRKRRTRELVEEIPIPEQANESDQRRLNSH
jgi:hypothetical protein